MPWRFRRSIGFGPFRVNLNKKSVSVTTGVRGLKMTKGAKGTTVSVGIPGSGLSYTEKIDGGQKKEEPEKFSSSNPVTRNNQRSVLSTLFEAFVTLLMIAVFIVASTMTLAVVGGLFIGGDGLFTRFIVTLVLWTIGLLLHRGIQEISNSRTDVSAANTEPVLDKDKIRKVDQELEAKLQQTLAKYNEEMEKLDLFEMDSLPEDQFVEMVAEVFRNGDNKVDVMIDQRGKYLIGIETGSGEKILAFVKKSMKPIGVQEIRDLYKMMIDNQVEKGWFITTDTYSVHARKWAADKPIMLIDRKGINFLVSRMMAWKDRIDDGG